MPSEHLDFDVDSFIINLRHSVALKRERGARCFAPRQCARSLIKLVRLKLVNIETESVTFSPPHTVCLGGINFSGRTGSVGHIVLQIETANVRLSRHAPVRDTSQQLKESAVNIVGSVKKLKADNVGSLDDPSVTSIHRRR